MKKVISAVLVLVMIVAMATSAFAAQFVPSISYKGAPTVKNATMTGVAGDVSSCLVVTSILGAQNKSTDVAQANRDLLLDVYNKLSNGSMSLPMEGEYVIMDLVDVDFAANACIGKNDGHQAALNKSDVSITITFETGVAASVELYVFQYKGGQWKAVNATNNGDGTVTCVFDDFCPVAFAVDNSQDGPSQTGDAFGQNMGLWVGLMVVSAGVLVVAVANRRKIFG